MGLYLWFTSGSLIPPRSGTPGNAPMKMACIHGLIAYWTTAAYPAADQAAHVATTEAGKLAAAEALDAITDATGRANLAVFPPATAS